VFLDAQIRFVIQQSIEDISGVTNTDIDDLGVEGRVSFLSECEELSCR